MEFRVNANENSKKWDRYREARVLLQDVAIKLVKDQVRVKLWLAVVLKAKAMMHVDEMRNSILLQRRQKFAEILLAIKFKVRFYCKFKRNYGPDHDTRLQKYLQRHLTLYGNTFNQQRIKKSQFVIHDILEKRIMHAYMRENVKRAIISCQTIVSLFKR